MDQSLLDARWDFNDPVASEVRFRSSIASSELTDNDRAELNTQLARAMGLQGRFDEARATLAATPPLSAVVESRIELELGRVENSSGSRQAAIPHFEHAARMAQQVGNDFLAVDALHMLAIVDPENGPVWSQQALDIVERSSDPVVNRWAIGLHNNLGWHWHDLGKFEQALGEFESASSAATAYGSTTQRFIARWAIARALRSLARNEEALAIQRDLAEEDPCDEYVRQEIAELTR